MISTYRQQHKLRLIPIGHFREQADLPAKPKNKLESHANMKRIFRTTYGEITVCMARRTPVAANGWPIDSEPPQLFHLFISGRPILPSNPM